MKTKPVGHTTVPMGGGRASAESCVVTTAVRWLFPDVSGSTTQLEKFPVVLGRDEDCDAVLDGPEVSRRHAEIRRDGSVMVVVDLGSTNGVHVNGVRTQQQVLSIGDLLRIGTWVGLVVEAEAEEPKPVFGRMPPGVVYGPIMRPLLDAASKTARTGLPIVLQGETGTGKEVFARALHAWSGRSGRFVALNCAALPESLAEAELFGYRKGAFTGAERASEGLVRAADGGTLLLDEIVDLPVGLQAKLLRVLEQREVVPLGESRPVPIDVRIVAAAQQPLLQAVHDKRFRADLFARLDGITLELPPLRDRLQEVPYLFLDLAGRHRNGVAPEVEAELIEQLCLYDWPFNVRELDLLAGRLAALHADEPLLRRCHLPKRMIGGRGPSTPPSGAKSEIDKEEMEEQNSALLLAALRRHRGNVAKAAADLGMSRQRAYRLMEGTAGVDLTALRAAPSARDDGGAHGGNA